MALTDSAVRNAKPSPDGKSRRLPDSGNLYLLIKPTGGKYWRYDYRHLGNRNTLPIGVYPALSLKEARLAHSQAQQ